MARAGTAAARGPVVLGAGASYDCASGIVPDRRDHYRPPLVTQLFEPRARSELRRIHDRAARAHMLLTGAVAALAVYRRGRPPRAMAEDALPIEPAREIRVIGAIREMQASGELPAPVNDGRCPRCSLIDACAPAAVATGCRSAARAVWRIPADEETAGVR